MLKSDPKTGVVPGHRLSDRQVGDPGPQPEVESEDRPSARVPGPDQHQHRRRRHRHRPAGAEGLAARSSSTHRRSRSSSWPTSSTRPQITFTPGSGDHYVALDNAHGVFTNVNLRRAAWANLDRAAIIKERGGSLTSEPATHFIYPGVSGFAQAGGYPGPQTDFNKNVNGDLAVAQKYMKAGRLQDRQVHGQPDCADRQLQQRRRPGDHAAAQHRPDPARLQDTREPGRPVGHVHQVLRGPQAEDRRLSGAGLGA